MKTKLWCCVKNENYQFSTLSYRKRDSIDSFIGNWKWEVFKKDGWKCIKVEVEIKPIGK